MRCKSQPVPVRIQAASASTLFTRTQPELSNRTLRPNRALQRRIMHVHRILVREVDLDEAEGILRPGKLAEIVIVDCGVRSN